MNRLSILSLLHTLLFLGCIHNYNTTYRIPDDLSLAEISRCLEVVDNYSKDSIYIEDHSLCFDIHSVFFKTNRPILDTSNLELTKSLDKLSKMGLYYRRYNKYVSAYSIKTNFNENPNWYNEVLMLIDLPKHPINKDTLQKYYIIREQRSNFYFVTRTQKVVY